ncbi:centrosomal protein 85kDa S homeolog [Xenopus laevis]|uniref:Centrosomal protein 85kDa S homeolog n=2 Tax=Xenopus laevis TaxID=8355 RepID=A0A8J0Q356_XENLA|nr:centrosomal protein 85kDa S homeolog [Xenopus laevis]
METIERFQDAGYQRTSRAESGPSQKSVLSHTEWQTPLVSGKAVSRLPTRYGFISSSDQQSGTSCPEGMQDFCNASGNLAFQPIRRQVTIPTAHVMPSTLGTPSSNTNECFGSVLPKDSALHAYSSVAPPEHNIADDTRKFETPNIEPTLNQSGLLNAFCTDHRPSASTGIVHADTEPYGALPEIRSTGKGEFTCKTGQYALYQNSHGWKPEQYSLQPGAEISAWRHRQDSENMRLRMEQLQLARPCPPTPVYGLGLQTDPGQWERILKTREGVFLEKEVLLERQRQHIFQLEQKLRGNEVQAHSTLLSQTSPYNDMYIIKMQELQREVTFLRAQFAEKFDSSSTEKAELEKKLNAGEAESRSLREAMKEAAQKHTEELRKQEERVKGRDRHINSLKKKCQKETEQNKEKQQRIETLERYLADLPTVQDHQKQTQELKGLQEKSSLLQEQVSELEKSLTEIRNLNREKETQLATEKRRGQELMSTIGSLKEEIECFKQTDVGEKEKRLTQESEELRQEVLSLQKEQECLRKVMESQKKKIEQMSSKVKVLEEQVAQEEGTGDALKVEVQRKETALQQLRAAVKELAVQNQDLMEQNVTLQERLRQTRGAAQPAELEAGTIITLYSELNLCLKDLRSICTLLSQRMEGRDPNLSLLLGIHSAPHVEDEDGASDSLSLDKHLDAVRRLKREIEDLRTTISDRYAQDMGDNCITQ